jgi:hypothetical protein
MTSGFDQLEHELRRAAAREGGRPRSVVRLRLGSRIASATWVAASTLAVVAIVVGALVLLHAAKGRVRSTAASGAVGHYTNPEGWSISYPRGFTISSARYGVGLMATTQVTLTSFAPVRRVKGRLTPRQLVSPFDEPYAVPLDRAGRFPADGVALILTVPGPGAGSSVSGPDSGFPIDVSQFGPAHAHPFFTNTIAARDGIPPARSDNIVAYSQEVTATALVGAKASPALRSELAAVIKSLAFRRLPPGTQVGPGYIIGPASRFPVGSFTRVMVPQSGVSDERAMPVYLVHAPGQFAADPDHQCPKTGSCTPPGAFYAMGETYSTRLNHAPNCDIQFERSDAQLSCTNLGVRWDRVGRVVKRPADEKYIGDIDGIYAKVTWDGQIMTLGGWALPQSPAAVHLLWPSWHQPKHPGSL